MIAGGRIAEISRDEERLQHTLMAMLFFQEQGQKKHYIGSNQPYKAERTRISAIVNTAGIAGNDRQQEE
ncbi:hypothetical protein ABW13_21630 [Pluralibacter gergoviae]|nr:hypothetical protein ABW13_21630 [Pluralibacter gergoviae]